MSGEPGIAGIFRSLAWSRVRLRILNYLADHCGLRFNAYEIATAVGITYDNVIGALSGVGSEYGVVYSLVGVGLVSRSEPGSGCSVAMYAITVPGFSAVGVVS
ncbi:MAG: archaellum operon transcriptional activator EarA family protein [Methanocella sp.]